MRIGEAFRKAGLLTEDQLKSALDEQKVTNARLGDIILRMGFVNTHGLATVLAQHFRIPFVDLKSTYKEINPEIVDKIPVELAERFKAIPINFASNTNTLVIAIGDPLNLVAVDTLRIKTGLRIQCAVAPEDDILEAIEYCYHQIPRMKEYIEDFIGMEIENGNGHTAADEDVERVGFTAADQPVVQYVQSLIVQAVNSDASDIHLLPKQDSVELRFRVDGVLHPVEPPPQAMLPAITTRVKILGGLDIAERRLPQDGRFKVKIAKNEVDLRVSIFPTIYGESVVMRLLDTSAPLVGLEHLGLSTDDKKRYCEIIFRPYGLILVTGPTGSGKTTTLYTTLNEIKSDTKNIVTLEDPVEYRLPFIQQTQVNPAIGFDFARGLRSMLRQDPDVIMVGEIRDRETAEIAIHAALTGHLVFATLHTNDAAGAAIRLVNMGVEPFLITSSLLGVVAQRLVRTICPHCKEPDGIDAKIWKELCLAPNSFKLYHGKGCPKCLKSGYKGRVGIFELLTPNEETKRLILERRSSSEIRGIAQKTGMTTLRQSAMEKMREGLTTPEEMFRVTQETED